MRAVDQKPEYHLEWPKCNYREWFISPQPQLCRSTSRRQLSATPSQATPLKSWKLGRLNHVAIAVPDLEAATHLYRDVLGGEVSETMVSWVGPQETITVHYTRSA